MTRDALHRLAGISAIALGVCAIGDIFWIIGSEMRGGKGGGGPVALPVPPIWFFGVGIVVVSSPWIAAGILLLRRSTAGIVLGWLILIPTMIVTGYCVFGCSIMLMGVIKRDAEPGLLLKLLEPLAMIIPLALLGLAFVVSFIWRPFLPERHTK